MMKTIFYHPIVTHYSQKEILMIDDQDLIIREQEGLDQLLIFHFDLTKVE